MEGGGGSLAPTGLFFFADVHHTVCGGAKNGNVRPVFLHIAANRNVIVNPCRIEMIRTGGFHGIVTKLHVDILRGVDADHPGAITKRCAVPGCGRA